MKLRAVALVLLVALAAYTVVVVAEHGMNFVPAFFGAIGELGWPGQINLDLITYLVLSALWVAWRHRFSAGGVALALVVLLLAGLAFLPYLLWALADAKGDLRALLLGRQEADRQDAARRGSRAVGP